MARSTRRDHRAWAGIDMGTQSVRCVIVADDGTVLGAGTAPLRSVRSGDRHEQDPDAWWAALGSACRAATAVVDPSAVKGVAVCGTSGTILLAGHTDADPAAPRSAALMYDDARAGAQAAVVRADPAPVWERNGVNPQRTWALPKALWLVENTGDLTGLRLAHQVDVVNSRLAGAPVATDTSNALKTGVDPVDVAWPTADLERLGLPPFLLPPVVRPGAVLGAVSEAAAAHTGLAPGTAIVAGMTDGCAAQIAAGVLEPGRWNFVIGTTTVLKGVSKRLLEDPSGVLYSHRAPDGNWWPGGASSAGAAALSGYDPARLVALDSAAAEREPADCVIYPLAGHGERFPFQRSDARWLELGAPRDEADRYAAILQGVAYVQRLCLDHVTSLGAPVTGAVTITGGAARSGYWPQLQADILGRTVQVPTLAEGAVGVAILASAGITGAATASPAGTAASLADTAARMTGPMTEYRPRPGSTERFLPGYRLLVSELADRGWIESSIVSGVS